MLCDLCNEPVEDADQPEGAALCNSCVAYLNLRFGDVGSGIVDAALERLGSDFERVWDANLDKLYEK